MDPDLSTAEWELSKILGSSLSESLTEFPPPRPREDVFVWAVAILSAQSCSRRFKCIVTR